MGNANLQSDHIMLESGFTLFFLDPLKMDGDKNCAEKLIEHIGLMVKQYYATFPQ